MRPCSSGVERVLGILSQVYGWDPLCPRVPEHSMAPPRPPNSPYRMTSEVLMVLALLPMIGPKALAHTFTHGRLVCWFYFSNYEK